MLNKIRSISIFLLAAVIFAATLTACGNNNNTSSKQTKESSSASNEQEDETKDDANSTEDADAPDFQGTVLTVAASQNWIEDIDRQLAEEFEQQTGIKVDFILSPDDNYQTIIKSKLNTGEGSDIFMSYSGTKLRDFNPDSSMVNLSNEPWVGNMKDWAIAGSTYNGTLYAFNTASIDVTNGVLYRPAVFEEYNIEVPKTYEEFKEACRVLDENGVLPIYEFVKDLWHAHYWIEGVAPKAVERDADVLDKLNRNELGFADVPEFVTALAQMKELADLGYLGQNHLSNTYDKSYEAIASGDAAMIIIHSSYPNELLLNVADVNPDEFSMFPNPLADNTGATLTGGGTTRCINANSKNIDAAKEYFNFLAQPEVAQRFYSERNSYMEASIIGVEGTPTLANLEIQKTPVRILGPEAYVYFYDGGKISELMQEMFVGTLTPEEVLQEFDTHRRNLAKDAGIDGF